MKAPQNLIKFQQEYSEFLRASGRQAKPEHVPARPSRVYQELLINNVFSFVNACFPVAKSTCTDAQWQALVKDFYQNEPCPSPYFKDISLAFLNFLETNPSQLSEQGLAPWFIELCHYEWVELYVETFDETSITPVNEANDAGINPSSSDARAKNVQEASLDEINSTAKINNQTRNTRAITPEQFETRNEGSHSFSIHDELVLNPSLQLLSYSWPVHQISKANTKPNPQATFIAVLRDSLHQVKFVELNQMTALLLSQFISALTIKQALKAFCKLAQQNYTAQLEQFALQQLNALADQALLKSL